MKQTGFSILCAIVCGLLVWAAAPVQPLYAQGANGGQQEADLLFDALLAARTPEQARVVEGEIVRRWRRTLSDTVALLQEQAVTLMAQGDAAGARGKLDGIVHLMPHHAEAWALRGEAHWSLGEHDAALSDLEAAVELEPRHFRALRVMAEVLEAEKDFAKALEAYRRALAIHPHLPGVADKIRTLARAVDTQQDRL